MISDLEMLALYGHQRCEKCGRNKLISRFSSHGNQLTVTCNSCRAARLPSEELKRKKALLDEARSTPCAVCNHTFPIICMDFDHLPTHKKSFNISSHWRTAPLKTLQQEMAKCEVVCSNCHRIRTHHERPHKRGLGQNQVSPLFSPSPDLPGTNYLPPDRPVYDRRVMSSIHSSRPRVKQSKQLATIKRKSTKLYEVIRD